MRLLAFFLLHDASIRNDGTSFSLILCRLELLKKFSPQGESGERLDPDAATPCIEQDQQSFVWNSDAGRSRRGRPTHAIFAESDGRALRWEGRPLPVLRVRTPGRVDWTDDHFLPVFWAPSSRPAEGGDPAQTRLFPPDRAENGETGSGFVSEMVGFSGKGG